MNFLITGLPRSGTAWLANWFTTDYSTCWHEALMDYDLNELMQIRCDGLFGVSETALCLIDPEIVNAIPVRKLVVHRPLGEVNQSLVELGLPGTMTEQHVKNLHAIDGVHVELKDIFSHERFRPIHEWLVPLRFNSERYRLLHGFNMENSSAVKRCLEMAA